MTSDESGALISFRSGRRRGSNLFRDIVESPRPPRSTSWTSASSGTSEGRRPKHTCIAAGRGPRFTARLASSSCAEPTRNMRAGGTPHGQGSRHHEPTVASPAPCATRGGAPRSTLWTPTHASWRGPGALAPPHRCEIGSTSTRLLGQAPAGPSGKVYRATRKWRRPSPCSTALPSVPAYSSRLAAAAADLYADQPISTRS